MMILLIVLGSVLVFLTLLSTLLVVITKKALRNDNQRLARLLMGLLVLQFILGMLANLFVTVPTFEPWRVFHYFGPILLHTFNALCILIFAVIFLVNALKIHRNVPAGIVGLTGVAVAFASGVTFVNAGQNNVFSFTMALGFIAALMAYASVAFKAVAKK